MIRSRAVNGIVWVILSVVLHVWPGMVGTAHGQGSRKDDIVFNTRGVPLAGATVRVCAMPATGQPCAPLAQIYSDAALTQALANPTTTDGLGNYSFFAAPGKYELEISGPGIITKQLPNVILPSDPSAPTFNSLSTSGGISAFTLNLSGNLTVNGSTSVVGNLSSGSLTMSNQGTAPGTPAAGSVNLYTKSADMRLYYKDETGAEIGPIANSSGAQTNVSNTWTAVQNMDADFHAKGPNPSWDVMRFGGYMGPNYNTPTTGSISSGSATLTLTSALDFANGNGILVLGAGSAPLIATPQAPTVTPYAQTGSTSYSYCVADRDWFGGITPCSPAGSTATGPASFAMQSYSISGWSASNGVVTITTSTPHNIPTTTFNGIYPQFEISRGSTNSFGCEGAYSATSVPDATHIVFTRYGTPDVTINACSGGTVRIQPKVALKWDAHYTWTVTNAACSGGTATLTLSGPVNGPNSTWMVPWFVNAMVNGVSDSHYNGTVLVSGWGAGGYNKASYPISGGNCSGVSTGNLGGTFSLIPGLTAKNALIYRCTGAACVLPANAGNYTLVGVATGIDGYFSDYGVGATASLVDLGDAPTTAPTTATNDWLSTTITNGGGTTSLSLANSATTTVSGAKVFHDNVPNLLAMCAAAPNNGLGTGVNGMHIVIPAPTAYAYSTNAFPINSNFQMGMANSNLNTLPNCPMHTTIELKGSVWLGGAILPAHGHSFISDQGASPNPAPGFYDMGKSMNAVVGNSYPLFYFEPEEALDDYFENLMLNVSRNYQSGFYYDQEMNGDGAVAQRYENVHVGGAGDTFPIVEKGGFGRFWNFGGWGASQTSFANGHGLTFTQNCGNAGYQRLGASGTGIVQTNGTYAFGVTVFDFCGAATGPIGHLTFNETLSEGSYGPAWYFNTKPYGLSEVNFTAPTYADFNGGYAAPFFDLTNSAGGVRFKDPYCGNGYQPLLETAPSTNYSGIQIQYAPNGAGCAYTGVQSYRLESDGLNLTTESNYNRQLLGTSEVYAPMSTPGPVTGLAQGGAGNVPVGTYSYCMTASDPFGGETVIGTNSCATVNVTGSPSVVNYTLPTSFPPGASGVNLYINGVLGAPACSKPQFTQPGTPQSYNLSYYCGNSPPTATTAVSNGLNGTAVSATKLWLNSEYVSAAPRAEQNIFLPGALTSTWTGTSWTLDRAITITRVQVQAKTGPTGCTTSAIVRLTDGATPVNLTISSAANDSGAITQNYAAGSTITVSVQTAAAGCSTAPADANVTVQYRMQ